MPRSTQEAMAIGRAIITTDVPGCRQTVVNQTNGFLINPFSAVNLAEKMDFFIKNPEYIKKMGDESYKIAQSYFDCHLINKKVINYLNDK